MNERGTLFGGDLGSTVPVREYDPVALTGQELIDSIFPLVMAGLVRVQYVVLNEGHNLTQQGLLRLVKSFHGNSAVAYGYISQEIQAATGSVAIYPANSSKALALGLELLFASNSGGSNSEHVVVRPPLQGNLFA